MIELKRFSFSLEGKRILTDISLTINKGEFVLLLGPNGAGKTTLLKCLVRIYRDGDGEILLDDQSLESYTQRDIARRLSYVPQSDGRLTSFTVYDFVAMGRYPHLTSFFSLNTHDREVVDSALDRTNTRGFADRSLETLSGGERQRVLIAAALAQEPQILLLDEPTAFLDPKHQDEVLDLLVELNRDAGLTIISVSHDINMAATQGQRILALREGRAVFDGTPAELMTDEVLESIYDKSFSFVEDRHSNMRYVVPGRRQREP